MPYSKCPICGDVCHLSVGNLDEWYRQLYPRVPVGSLVPGKCFYCWQELSVDDIVIVRKQVGTETPVEVGTRGRLIAILSSPEHGAIYQVLIDSGMERFFVRGELRMPRDGEIN
jgi:hypothetical protein